MIEDLRRELLDFACRHGYELVTPPPEHIESLLTGTGEDLELQTLLLVDQLSGRTLGVRADTTQQTARIDAHLLNRQGTTRLCYCGPVLHTRLPHPNASREPLQFGAELYGCSDIAADIEIVLLALTLPGHHPDPARKRRGGGSGRCPHRAGPAGAGARSPGEIVHRLQQALITKNADALRHEAAALPAAVRQALHRLLDLYGTAEVLDAARQHLPALPEITQALDELAALAAHIASVHPALRVQFDLADSQGYSYYSGMRFAIYLPGGSDAMVRGGRYDEVGAAFGRMRPAVGFSLDVKALAQHVAPRPKRPAIRATWEASAGWQEAVQGPCDAEGKRWPLPCPARSMRRKNFVCDRALTRQDGRWLLQAV